MIMSFNADIVARTPKKKPFFWPEQIAGFEHMYDGNDDYPYYLLNRTDENNGEMPTQPLAYYETRRSRKPTPTCWKQPPRQ